MEKVAKIFADHLSKSNLVNIPAELAATTLRGRHLTIRLQATSLPEPPTQKPPIPAGPELPEALTNHSQAVADMPPP
ncbi:TPA: hypothetical protein ACH3X1_015983 [Trebouxia sp. C0004]